MQEAAELTLNGIEIISVEGESNGEFIKDSRIFAGAYEYSLTRGNTEATNKNWYLTNFQATSGGETNSGGSSAPTVAPTPSCASKLEVTSPTWQPLTLFLLCV